MENQEERKKRLLEQREKIRKKKEDERRKMLEDSQLGAKQPMNIVLQEDGIHESCIGVRKPVEKEDTISNEELNRRKELMKKIKNRIVDDF